MSQSFSNRRPHHTFKVKRCCQYIMPNGAICGHPIPTHNWNMRKHKVLICRSHWAKIHSYNLKKSNQKRSLTAWPLTEVEKLKKVYSQNKTEQAILHAFPDKSLYAIRSKASRLGLTLGGIKGA